MSVATDPEHAQRPIVCTGCLFDGGAHVPDLGNGCARADSISVQCSLSTISYTQFVCIGLPRKLPPVDSPEFLAYQTKYTLANDVHPFFTRTFEAKVSILRSQNKL